jgi:predicted NAD/FAD-binding protein
MKKLELIGTGIAGMDTGFMVFNEKTYPNLLKLFKKLDVPCNYTDMSFSVRNDEIDLEFNGSSLGGIS